MDRLDHTSDGRLSVELHGNGDRSTVVKLTGELDISTAPKLAAVVEPIIGAGADRLVIDASGLTFADSSAIALWVSWANAVRRIEIHEPSELLQRVITRMGLAERLHLSP